MTEHDQEPSRAVSAEDSLKVIELVVVVLVLIEVSAMEIDLEPDGDVRSDVV